MKNKRGFEMTITTIIVIVLGLLLLVSLLWILNSQTGFFNSIVNSLQGKSNADAVVSGCNNIAVSNQIYEYCCVNKTINFGDRKEEGTCNYLEQNSVIGDRIEKLDCESQKCSE